MIINYRPYIVRDPAIRAGEPVVTVDLFDQACLPK